MTSCVLRPSNVLGERSAFLWARPRHWRAGLSDRGCGYLGRRAWDGVRGDASLVVLNAGACWRCDRVGEGVRHRLLFGFADLCCVIGGGSLVMGCTEERSTHVCVVDIVVILGAGSAISIANLESCE